MIESSDSSPLAEAESKQRRLVPQFSLNNRQEIKPSPVEPAKKSVLRFTREQLIALRRHANPLPSMKAMSEVFSPSAQEPVCFTKLEPEDVIRIWNAATKDVNGRGRGRARVPTRQDEGDEGISNPHGDLWDDGLLGTSDLKDFDLSEISKASLQFRNDMENLKISDDIEVSTKERDAMESLIEEQQLDDEPLETPQLVEKPVVIEVKTTTAASVSLSSAIDTGFGNLPLPTFGLNLHKELDISLEKTLLSDSSSFLNRPLTDPVSDYLSPLPATSTSSILSTAFPVTSLFQPEPVLYPKVDPEWFYTDPQHQVQGPFTQENMRLWNEAGYFARDLPIKLRQWTSFHLFKDVFPESRVAFYSVPSEPVRPAFPATGSSLSYLLNQTPAPSLSTTRPVVEFSQEKPIERASSSLLNVQEKEIQRTNNPHQHSNKASASSDRTAIQVKEETVTAAPQQQSKQAKDKSDYAKQILGISRNTSSSSSEPVAHKEVSPPTPQTAQPDSQVSQSEANTEQKSKAGWKTTDSTTKNKPVSFLDIQQEAAEEHKVVKEKTPIPTSPVAAVPPNPNALSAGAQLKSLLGLKPQGVPSATNSTAGQNKGKGAWSSSSTDVPSIPLTEIMQQEISQQQQKKEESSGSRTRGSTWASKIASRGEPQAAPLLPPVAGGISSAAQSIKSPPSASAATATPSTTPSDRKQRGADKSDFGGKKMSKELSDWCSSQLKAIKGIEDLTLMEFCMSLNSAAEIRETLSSYLGSSPQVTNFATEFIKFKDEGRPPSKPSSHEIQSATSNLPKKKKAVK